MAIIKHRKGHDCATAWIVVSIVLWEAIPADMADHAYTTLSYKMGAFGFATQRRKVIQYTPYFLPKHSMVNNNKIYYLIDTTGAGPIRPSCVPVKAGTTSLAAPRSALGALGPIFTISASSTREETMTKQRSGNSS